MPRICVAFIFYGGNMSKNLTFPKKMYCPKCQKEQIYNEGHFGPECSGCGGGSFVDRDAINEVYGEDIFKDREDKQDE